MKPSTVVLKFSFENERAMERVKGGGKRKGERKTTFPDGIGDDIDDSDDDDNNISYTHTHILHYSISYISRVLKKDLKILSSINCT